jgi:hypothetical protein
MTRRRRNRERGWAWPQSLTRSTAVARLSLGPLVLA